jgi:DNA polymerase-3 subunit delta'
MTSPEPSATLGHESIRDRLFRVSKARLLPSTYLFWGPDGVGKRRVSLEWARSLLCAGDPEDTLDQCSSCRHFETSGVASHPDISILKPDSEGESIRIDPAREFLSSLSSPPLIGRRRLGLIDDAHRMTTEASNALLKTLEDPPENTILILLTHIPDALLPTIRSRCLSVRFNPVSPERLLPLLDRLAPGLSPAQRNALLFLSRGAPGKISQAIESGDQELLVRILDLLSAPPDGFPFDAEILQALSTQEGFTLFIDTLESMLGALYRRDAGLPCDPLFEVPRSRLGDLSSLPPFKRERFHDRVQHLRTLQVYNINRGLAIEELLWDWRDTLISLKTRP